MVIQPPSSTEERKEAERALRAGLAAEPRRADLWIELGKLLSASDQKSDQRTAESCWQRARLLDPTIQIDAFQLDGFSDKTTTDKFAEPTAAPLNHPVLGQADVSLLDGFFAESSATDRSSLDSLFQLPFACRPIVITGGEFCGTEELFRLLAGHSRITALDVSDKTPEEIHSALRSAGAGQRVLIHAPAWEHRLDSLAKWPGATVVWLDRDLSERVAEMTDQQLVLECFGPWGTMRPWSVHPDGGPLAFERCLHKFEEAGNAIPSTVQKAWDCLQNTKPFRRSLQQARWLAPEYCRMLARFWQTSASETSIRVKADELVESYESVTHRVLAFANVPTGNIHKPTITHQHKSKLVNTARKTASSLWH